MKSIEYSGTISPISYLKTMGYTPISDLVYCTEQGNDYTIGVRGNEAIIIALHEDIELTILTKDELREMALSAKIKGIDKVHLYTNCGIEMRRDEKPGDVGFTSFTKLINEW